MGELRKTEEDVGLANSPTDCMPSRSKYICISYCLINRDTCAGILFKLDVKSCCLLTDFDIILGERISRPNSEIWRWSEDVEYNKI